MIYDKKIKMMKYGDTRFLPDSNDIYLYILFYFNYYFVDLANIS